MSKPRVVLHGVPTLLRSDQVKAGLRACANEIESMLPPGYVVRISQNRKPKARARAVVITATGEAIRDNRKNNTLARAGGR